LMTLIFRRATRPVAVVVFHELFARRLPAVVGKEGEQDPPNDSKREFDRGHGFS